MTSVLTFYFLERANCHHLWCFHITDDDNSHVYSNYLMAHSAASILSVFPCLNQALKLLMGWCNSADEAVKAAWCCGGSTCRDTLTCSQIHLHVCWGKTWLWLWCDAIRVCYEGLAVEVINRHLANVASFEAVFNLNSTAAKQCEELLWCGRLIVHQGTTWLFTPLWQDCTTRSCTITRFLTCVHGFLANSLLN